MKIRFVPFVPVLFFTFGLLHKGDETWLLPDKFFYEKGEEATISVQSGEDFIGQAIVLGKHTVNTVMHIAGSTRTDLKMRFKEGDKQPLQIVLAQEGTHVVTLETNAVPITKEAEHFNQYLKNYGLDDVYHARETSNTLDVPAQLEQANFHKLIFQVGHNADDGAGSKPIGFPIEIIPHKNPYVLKKGDPIQFTILSAGKPVFGTRVRIWNRFNNRTTIQQIYTEQDGSIRTHLSNPGLWMVTAAKMEPLPGKAATWKSYQTTLIFGVK